ncbi:MAG TPA: hypothetical protein VIG35_03215, partial [Gaiellaceae bacterium]
MTNRRELERWISIVRLVGVVFACLEIGFLRKGVPAGYESAAWVLTAVFGLTSIALYTLTRNARDELLRIIGVGGLLFDAAAIGAYATIFSYEYGNQTRWAEIFAVAEAAIRYGLRGGVVIPVLLGGFFAFNEWWRAREFGPPRFSWGRVTFPTGVLFLTGLIVGWLVSRLDFEAQHGIERAAEAERLRDALGRRVDVLEAANRCARALGSSLEIEQAFGAFIREVRGLV